MMQRLFNFLHMLWVPALCALSGLALLLADPLPKTGLRNAMFDQYQRWQPRTYVDVPVPVRVVDIDDESLARLGQWPWPRTRVAQLVQALRNAEAAAIGFDVVFAEPDRTSPVAMSSLWNLQGPLADTMKRLPDHDAVFAYVIGQGGVVLDHAAENVGSKLMANRAALAAASISLADRRAMNTRALMSAATALGRKLCVCALSAETSSTLEARIATVIRKLKL